MSDINGNTFLGVFSLHENKGKNNTAVGYGALRQNDSDHNIAIGLNALKQNTGNNNIAIGENSIFSNKGNNNISVGNNTLKNNQEGNHNIAFGNQSLEKNINGESNIAIGVNALHNNTSGSKNISIGNQSLNNNTSGLSNISIGNQTCYHNLSGTGNAAIGFNALSNNNDGNYNIAIGSNSSKLNLGHNNIAIGNDSFSNATGDNNIAIGDNSLLSTPFIPSTSLNNIAIGKNTDAKGHTNCILIGNNACASSSEQLVICGVTPLNQENTDDDFHDLAFIHSSWLSVILNNQESYLQLYEISDWLFELDQEYQDLYVSAVDTHKNVIISSDGMTFLVGDYQIEKKCVIFRYNTQSSSWMSQTIQKDEIEFGRAIGISSNGSFVVLCSNNLMYTYEYNSVNSVYTLRNILNLNKKVYAISMSQDGTMIAIAYVDSNLTTVAFGVYIYDNTSKKWNLQNNENVTLFNANELGVLGISISLGSHSNVHRVAIGVPGYQTNKGITRLYKYNNNNNSWNNIVKEYIGAADNDMCGTSVNLSSNIIAIGTPGYNSKRGVTKVYTINDDNGNDVLIQLGQSIVGKIVDELSGTSVSLVTHQNVHSLAIGVPEYKLLENKKGVTRVYQYNTSLDKWRRFGGHIGENYGKSGGRSVSLGFNSSKNALGLVTSHKNVNMCFQPNIVPRPTPIFVGSELWHTA